MVIPFVSDHISNPLFQIKECGWNAIWTHGHTGNFLEQTFPAENEVGWHLRNGGKEKEKQNDRKKSPKSIELQFLVTKFSNLVASPPQHDLPQGSSGTLR